LAEESRASFVLSASKTTRQKKQALDVKGHLQTIRILKPNNGKKQAVLVVKLAINGAERITYKPKTWIIGTNRKKEFSSRSFSYLEFRLKSPQILLISNSADVAVSSCVYLLLLGVFVCTLPFALLRLNI